MQGEMKLTANFWILCQRLYKRIGKKLRLQGTKTDPLDPRDILALPDGVQQVGAVPQILTIAHQVNAGQHHLGIAVFPQPGQLAVDIGKGAGTQRPPGIRNDAIGAIPVAALLDL